MTDATNDKRDFFVSFNQADRAWATWIAWVLEEAGYSVFFQDWDFRGNFVEQMHQAQPGSRRTLAVLSARLSRAPTSQRPSGPPASPKIRPARTIGSSRSRSARSGRDGLLAPDRLPRSHRLQPRRSRALASGAGPETLDADYRAKPDEAPRFPGGATRSESALSADQPRFPIATNNLPPHNPDFVGREGVLAELRRLLLAGQGPAVLTQAITGLGGIGKTQTARAYAYRHLADYALIWWLRAETPATLAADYATLAGPLGLDPGTADQAQLTAAIKQRLQAMPGWLLVFDNVEDPALPRAWLPGTGGGHALITSRRTDWRGLARALSLELMPEDEALQLLTGRPDPQALPPAELAAARELAAELGCLPLALAQARAYMAETGKSLAGYLRLFRSSRPADFAADAPSPDYPASYATTWRISIDAAAAACPAARPLLELLAFLAPDPLPIEVLGADPAALPEGLRSEHARDDAIAALRRYSLIAAEAGEITVHRLVQAVTRDGLDEATQRRLGGDERAVGQRHALPTSANRAHELAGIRDLAAARARCGEWAEQLEAGLETAATVLNETALYHQARAAWAEAEPLFQRAIAIGEKDLGPEHPDLATGLNNLAELYRATGRYAEAEPLYQRAIAIGEKTLGPDHPDLATRLNNLADLYRATGRYAEAEPLYQRAIAIGEKTLGPDHPDLAIWLNNLAGLYRATGRYAEAEPLFQRAIAIGEKTLGPEHPDLANRLNNLAELYRPPAATPRPSPSTSAPSRSARRPSAPTTPTSPPGSTTSPSSTGHRPLRRGRAALPARHRHRREGPRPRPPRPRHRLNNLANLYRPPAARPRPSPSTSAPSPSARRSSAPTTPTSPPSSTTSPISIGPPGATPRPSPSSSAPSRSRQIARPRPPRPRHPAQQPRPSLRGHRPLLQGRAPLPARHRHSRGQPAARSSRSRTLPARTTLACWTSCAGPATRQAARLRRCPGASHSRAGASSDRSGPCRL